MKRRLKLTGIMMSICIVLLMGRLYYIQIICGDELKAGAESQQLIPVLQQYQRGTIFDRNMNRMTNTSWNYYYLIHKACHTEEFKRLIALSDGELVGTKGEDYLVYRVEKFQATLNLLLKENCRAYGFCVGSRYEDDQVAAHVIGYLNEADGTGSCGLELLYEEQLGSLSPRIYLLGDGVGDLIEGAGVAETNGDTELEPSSLVTTIDRNLQEKVENLLKTEQLSGSVIVMETETGQILTMASSPTFNPNDVGRYLESEQSELVNKSVQGQYPPGSVFKIVVAAAALEHGIVPEEEQYTCTGKIKINGVELTCDEKKQGHGELNLSQAFAKSCNCYFAQLAKKIGSEPIADAAGKMGLGEVVLNGFPGEEKGNLPSYTERSFSGLTNFSIGQGSLLVTPLQICQITNVIASEGKKRGVSLVMRTAQLSEEEQVLNEASAQAVKEMMERVMTEGTGAVSDFDLAVAGKTGSAEATVNGIEVVHGWFTGFFPAENPKYTVTVLIENGKTGSQSALPVFQEIVNYLY